MTFFLILISVSLLSSCVNKKKYLDTLSKNLSCEERALQINKRLENTNLQLRQLTRENGLLETRIDQLEDEKSQNRTLITDLRSQIDDITGKAMSEQARLDQALKGKAEELAKREVILNRLQTLREYNDNAINDLLFKIYDAIGTFAEDELSIEMKNEAIMISIFNKVLFKKGSNTINSRGKEILKALAIAFNTHPELGIIVEGHTNEIKSATNNYKDNWDLSVVRSASVVRAFIYNYGLPATQLTASGRGNMILKYSEDDIENKEKNNRTEILILPKTDELYRILKKGVK